MLQIVDYHCDFNLPTYPASEMRISFPSDTHLSPSQMRISPKSDAHLVGGEMCIYEMQGLHLAENKCESIPTDVLGLAWKSLVSKEKKLLFGYEAGQHYGIAYRGYY